MDNNITTEPLFHAETRVTYEEYRKFYAAIQMNNYSVIVVAFSMLCFCISSIISRNPVIIIVTILIPVVLFIIIVTSMKKGYEKNKRLSGEIMTVDFYNDRIALQSKLGNSVIANDNIYKILETKTNYYIMILRYQGAIIQKSECSEGLVAYIGELRKTMKMKKK